MEKAAKKPSSPNPRIRIMLYVDLEIPLSAELVTVKFKLPQRLLHRLDLYLKAVHQSDPQKASVDRSLLVEAILARHLGRDGKFSSWLKKQPPHVLEAETHKGPDEALANPIEQRERGAEGENNGAPHVMKKDKRQKNDLQDHEHE
jgi:hypothetical protein